MPGVEVRYDSSERRGIALNALLGVSAEALSAAADVMLLPSLILAFFVAELTPSYPTIGLVPAIAVGFWTLARFPGHVLTMSRRRKQPWAFGAAIARAGAVAVLALVVSRTGPDGLSGSARPLLATFFLCLTVYSLAGGFGSVPGAALLGHAVSGQAWAAFSRQRSVWSALLSVAGALVVMRLLGSSAIPFPGNYGRLFLAATVCLIAVAVITAAIREPTTFARGAVEPMSPRMALSPLYDGRYRRFLIFRVLLSATAAIDPFLFLYAVTRLGTPVNTIGAYALAAVLGWIVSTPFWLWLDRRAGPRGVLQGAAVIRLMAPAFALVLPQLTAMDFLRARLPDLGWVTVAYGLAIFLIGAAMAAQARANHDYLTGLAPQTRIRAYTGLTNVVLAVVAFSPVLGGLIIQRAGYEILFGVALVIGLAAVFAGGWMDAVPAVTTRRAALPDNATPRALSAGRV